ncbi:MAG: VPLPA-CTERM sorting domain-containing protein [Pseudomonadota bacterium]
MRFPSALALSLGIFATTHALGANYDESVDGDLSTEPETPTFIDFDVGSNIVTGSVVSPDDTRDFLTFTIEAGEQLDRIILLDYVDLDTGEPGNTGYIAISEGITSEVPGTDNLDFFLGGVLLVPDIGGDFLDLMANDSLTGGPFEIPLGPGDYSIVIQQTGEDFTGWSFDFQVSAVPLPAAAWLFGAGLLSLLGVGRRRNA